MVNNKTMPHRIKPSFDVYDGDDKYIFITYAHKDAKEVISDLEKFSHLGINIFYDEGLHAGHNWVESIEEKILDSEIFIPFLSPNTTESRFSVDEILLAYTSNITILPIYLEYTILSKGLRLALGSRQSIFKYEMQLEDYVNLYVREFKRLGLVDSIDEDAKSTKQTVEPKPGLMQRTLKRIGFGKRQYNPQLYSTPHFTDKITYDEIMGTSLEHDTPNVEYRKNNPIYISYSNKDIGSVIPEIERYIQDGYKIKFDKGLNYNNKDDLSKLLDLISSSKIFVVFISENSIDSNQVKMELKTAYDNHKIIIPIYLEETELSFEFESFLEPARFINKYMMNEEQYIETYVDAFDTVLIKK